MSATHVIGVDPGLEGAMVHLDHLRQVRSFAKTPVVRSSSNSGGKTQYNEREMAEVLQGMVRAAQAEGALVKVAVEDVHAAPGQGVVSMFRFGYGYGLWCGIVAQLGVPLVRIRPQAWQRLAYAGRDSSDKKQASILVAREKWPALPLRSKSADSGVSDAALLAWAVSVSMPA